MVSQILSFCFEEASFPSYLYERLYSENNYVKENVFKSIQRFKINKKTLPEALLPFPCNPLISLGTIIYLILCNV